MHSLLLVKFFAVVVKGALQETKKQSLTCTPLYRAAPVLLQSHVHNTIPFQSIKLYVLYAMCANSAVAY